MARYELPEVPSTSAPNKRSLCAMEEIVSFGLVTSTLQPKSGSFSYHANSSARAHTFPTTIIAGVSIPCFFHFFCKGADSCHNSFLDLLVVPFLQNCSQASFHPLPACKRELQISSKALTPIKNTNVPLVFTKALKSIS